MLSKLKHPIALAAGAAVVAMVLIFVSVYEWGSEDRTASDVTYRTYERPAPAEVVHAPQPAPAPAAAPALETAPEAAAVTEPEPPKEVTYEDAETAFFEKRYDAAVEMFTRYTDRKSENPWGFYMLGLSAWKAGDNEGAEAAFERALELDQKHVKSWINLSRVLLDASRPSEALARLDEALALDPQSNAAYRLRGRAFQQLGRIDESISAYRRAIQIDETDAWSMNNLGLLYIEDGRVEEALPALARAVELRDDVAVFYNNLGMASEEMYAKAVAADESHEKAKANLVRVEEVVEDPAVEPVDLAALAQAFIAEIGSWTVAQAEVEPQASVDAGTESVVVSEATGGAADTTATDQER
jgi:tetratricopeptide (TPR) repeat protein